MFSAGSAAEKIDLKRITPVPASETIPVSDFFRPSLLTRPKLNSAGTHFGALVDTGADHTAILIYDLGKQKGTMVRGSSNKDISSIAWLDQSHLLASMISDKRFAEGLLVANAEDPSDNYLVEAHSATALVGVPTKTKMKPLVWIYRNAYDEGNDLGVVQLDATKALGKNRGAMRGSIQAKAHEDETSLYGARASIVRAFSRPPGGGVVSDYMADKDGQLVFAIVLERGVSALFRLAGDSWIKCPVDLDAVMPVDVGDRANELIVVGPRTEGKPRALQRLDASTGELGAVLLQDKSYDPVNCTIYRHPESQLVIGARFHRNLQKTVWFDETYSAVQKILSEEFPEKIALVLGSDDARKKFFVAVYSDRQPVVYYSLDLNTQVLCLVKNSSPWIDPERMRPTNVIKIKTRDEHQFDAYLTLPAGASKTNPPPLVVLPHGGPWARDTWGYDGEIQFLASRGYAVLQPNYRGSTGYNWMFPKADTWAFRKMHDDVTDAVKTLVNAGLVDPSRMAIMGTSFGGYLAVCGAAFEPDLYRCAITISGVFDWEQAIREKKYDQYDTGVYGILLRNLGDPKTNREEFDRISPLRHLDHLKIPVFVAHGKEDEIAAVGESRALIAQLGKRNVPFESMLVRGEGHGMSNADNQVELYTRIEAFLGKYLKPAQPVAAAR